MTFEENIKLIALSTSEEEFNKWLHNQVIELAEYMKSLGIDDPYEKAKVYVFKKIQEAINKEKKLKMKKIDIENLELLKRSFKNINDYLGENDQPKSEEAEYVLVELCKYVDEAEIYYDELTGQEEIFGIYVAEEMLLYEFNNSKKINTISLDDFIKKILEV